MHNLPFKRTGASAFAAVRLLPVIAIAVFAAHATAADSYPTKPIKVVVNSAPGGLTDVVARLVTNKMGQQMGQTFVVENRAGVPVVGADALAKSTPDGYTIGVLGNSVSAMPAMFPALPFHVEKDLVPVALLISAPLVMDTGINSPYKTVADYVADAKARPGQVAFASGGNATMSHLLPEQFQVAAGLKLVHVPYKGGAPAMNDLMAGHVPVFFDVLSTTLPLAREKKVRPLAVIAKNRVPQLPDVPTMAEAGYPDVQGSSWFAIFAPGGTPPDVVARLNAEANKALQSPEIKERLGALGSLVEGGPPKVLDDLMKTEVPRWTKLIRERQIKAE